MLNSCYRVYILGLLLCLCSPTLQAAKVKLSPDNWNHPAGQECVSCHSKASQGIVKHWQASAHAEAKVNCMDCHGASEDEVDAIRHEGQTISVIVSPKDCGRCHVTEYEEQKGSSHSEAFTSIQNRRHALLNLSGANLETATCGQCHGVEVKVRGDGQLENWPSSGIGRINPDGSKGSCSACHGRHRFDVAEARDPAGCIRCHSGPHAPDSEIYAASKHGMSYAVHRDEMNLNGESWSAGKDYDAAPTCATCHMSSVGKVPATHDPGMRNAWNLSGPVSEKQALIIFEDGDKLNLPESSSLPRRGEEISKIDGSMGKVKIVAPSKMRRRAMQLICLECHSKPFAEDTLAQFDKVVESYNTRFGKPAQAMMQALYSEDKLTPAAFDEPVEFTYWEIWHGAGLRARHGTAMGSPNHAWWEGLFQVAEQFYAHFIPQVRSLGLDPHSYLGDGHQWLNDSSKMNPLLRQSSPRPDTKQGEDS